MDLIPQLDCLRCHNVVTPVKALFNYCCPSCGSTIEAWRVNQAIAKRDSLPPTADESRF
jgi:predicted RNA-binding Zn-ribbon protein involved in translation (DUF1610 family)